MKNDPAAGRFLLSNLQNPGNLQAGQHRGLAGRLTIDKPEFF